MKSRRRRGFSSAALPTDTSAGITEICAACAVRTPGRDKPFRSLMKRAWLDARLELYADRPAKLTLKAQSGAEVTFTGSVPGDATGDALTKERARSSLSKLGGHDL